MPRPPPQAWRCSFSFHPEFAGRKMRSTSDSVIAKASRQAFERGLVVGLVVPTPKLRTSGLSEIIGALSRSPNRVLSLSATGGLEICP